MTLAIYAPPMLVVGEMCKMLPSVKSITMCLTCGLKLLISNTKDQATVSEIVLYELNRS